MCIGSNMVEGCNFKWYKLQLTEYEDSKKNLPAIFLPCKNLTIKWDYNFHLTLQSILPNKQYVEVMEMFFFLLHLETNANSFSFLYTKGIQIKWSLFEFHVSCCWFPCIITMYVDIFWCIIYFCLVHLHN